MALIAAREFGISAWRTYWGRRGVSIPARRSAKHKTLVQGVALLIAVLPPLEDADALHSMLLWLAVAFTLFTGAQYAVDGKKLSNQMGELA